MAWFGEHSCNGLLPIQLASMFRPLRKDKEIINQLRMKTKAFYVEMLQPSQNHAAIGLREACEYCLWADAEASLMDLALEAGSFKRNLEGAPSTDLTGGPDVPPPSPGVGGSRVVAGIVMHSIEDLIYS